MGVQTDTHNESHSDKSKTSRLEMSRSFLGEWEIPSPLGDDPYFRGRGVLPLPLKSNFCTLPDQYFIPKMYNCMV